MSKTLVLVPLLYLAGCSFQATLEGGQSARFLSANFSTNLKGEADIRPSTWGTAGYQIWTLQFTPPPNTPVEILGVSGDLVAWPTLAGQAPAIVEVGRFAGVLFGLQTTGPEGSVNAKPAADNTFLYVQGVVDQHGTRVPFNRELGLILPPDNKVLVKVAVWLNDTNCMIHVEPTFTVKYRLLTSPRSSRSAQHLSYRPAQR